MKRRSSIERRILLTGRKSKDMFQLRRRGISFLTFYCKLIYNHHILVHRRYIFIVIDRKMLQQHYCSIIVCVCVYVSAYNSVHFSQVSTLIVKFKNHFYRTECPSDSLLYNSNKCGVFVTYKQIYHGIGSQYFASAG